MITVFNASFYGGDRQMKMPVPQRLFDGVEYVMFTNNKDLPTDNTWRYIYMDTDNPRLSAREIKIKIHEYFSTSEYWMWLDSNMKVETDPNKIVNHYMSNHDICAMPHPERNNWYDESKLIVDSNRDDREVVIKMVNRYFDEGCMPTSLYETGVLLRRNTDKVIEFNNIWWEELSNGSIRDQLSFPYSAWKCGMAINTFAGTNSVNALRYKNKNYLPQWGDVIRDWN